MRIRMLAIALRLITMLVLLFLSVTPAAAQVEPTVSYSLGIFASTVTDPNVGPPVAAPVVYPVAQVTCGQPKIVPPVTISNPTEARFDDPSNATLDCRFTIAPQVTALPIGTAYRAASRANGATVTSAWSTLSNPFDRALTPPPVPVNTRVR